MTFLKKIKQKIKACMRPLTRQLGKENEALYRLMYHAVHDLDQALPLASILVIAREAEKKLE